MSCIALWKRKSIWPSMMHQPYGNVCIHTFASFSIKKNMCRGNDNVWKCRKIWWKWKKRECECVRVCVFSSNKNHTHTHIAHLAKPTHATKRRVCSIWWALMAGALRCVRVCCRMAGGVSPCWCPYPYRRVSKARLCTFMYVLQARGVIHCKTIFAF
jgi:hypothetical protein